MVSHSTVLKSSTARQLKVRTISKSFLNYVRMVRLSFFLRLSFFFETELIICARAF